MTSHIRSTNFILGYKELNSNLYYKYLKRNRFIYVKRNTFSSESIDTESISNSKLLTQNLSDIIPMLINSIGKGKSDRSDQYQNTIEIIQLSHLRSVCTSLLDTSMSLLPILKHCSILSSFNSIDVLFSYSIEDDDNSLKYAVSLSNRLKRLRGVHKLLIDTPLGKIAHFDSIIAGQVFMDQLHHLELLTIGIRDYACQENNLQSLLCLVKDLRYMFTSSLEKALCHISFVGLSCHSPQNLINTATLIVRSGILNLNYYDLFNLQELKTSVFRALESQSNALYEDEIIALLSINASMILTSDYRKNRTINQINQSIGSGSFNKKCTNDYNVIPYSLVESVAYAFERRKTIRFLYATQISALLAEINYSDRDWWKSMEEKTRFSLISIEIEELFDCLRSISSLHFSWRPFNSLLLVEIRKRLSLMDWMDVDCFSNPFGTLHLLRVHELLEMHVIEKFIEWCSNAVYRRATISAKRPTSRDLIILADVYSAYDDYRKIKVNVGEIQTHENEKSNSIILRNWTKAIRTFVASKGGHQIHRLNRRPLKYKKKRKYIREEKKEKDINGVTIIPPYNEDAYNSYHSENRRYITRSGINDIVSKSNEGIRIPHLQYSKKISNYKESPEGLIRKRMSNPDYVLGYKRYTVHRSHRT